METRYYNEKAKHSYTEGELSGKLDLRLDLIVTLRLQTDGLKVDIDHEKRVIKIFISKKPRFDEDAIEHYDPHLKKLVVKYSLPPCPLFGVGERLNDTHISADLPNAQAQKDVLSAKIPEASIREMPISTSDLGQDAKAVFIPILKAAFLPMINLRYSFYTVDLFFSDERIKLL